MANPIFQQNTKITSFNELKYFKNLTTLNANAFYGCTALTNVTFPDKLTTIGQSAFYGCTSFEMETFPKSVKYLGRSAFQNCSKIGGDYDLFNIKEAGLYQLLYAFKGTKGITTLYIPNITYTTSGGIYSSISDTYFTNMLGLGITPTNCNDTYPSAFSGVLVMNSNSSINSVWCSSYTPTLVFKQDLPPSFTNLCKTYAQHRWSTSSKIYVQDKTITLTSDYYGQGTDIVFASGTEHTMLELYQNHSIWKNYPNIYLIGGTEWVAQFGAKDERAYLIGTIAETGGHVVVTGTGEDRVVTDTGV